MSDRIEILSLGVMQHSLRSAPICNIITPICIAEFEDGRRLIRDGHHRCVHLYLSGRTHLEPGEYVIENYTYELWMHPSIEKEFYTPHDPRTEIRKADFKAHNDAVKHILVASGPDAALDYIASHRADYCLKRCSDALTIRDVAVESGLAQRC